MNNGIYELYGDRWYTAYDDPVALLRAETKVKAPWILERIGGRKKVLDVGCGGGFLSNLLAKEGLDVTGVDLSPESLACAARHDHGKTAKYLVADALDMPFPDASFDVVTAMDFLEHVERPDLAIREMSRLLKPGGLLFFHTFNRNWLAYLVVIKAVEWLVRNTPKDMHVLRLFVTPAEARGYCQAAGLEVAGMSGIRPRFRTIPLRNLFTGVVPGGLEFCLTKSLKLSYIGFARKL